MIAVTLSKDILDRCGFKYSKKLKMYFRDHSKVMVKHFADDYANAPDRWYAYLMIEEGQKNPYVCELDSLERLLLLSLAIDGSSGAVIMQNKVNTP